MTQIKRTTPIAIIAGKADEPPLESSSSSSLLQPSKSTQSNSPPHLTPLLVPPRVLSAAYAVALLASHASMQSKHYEVF